MSAPRTEFWWVSLHAGEPEPAEVIYQGDAVAQVFLPGSAQVFDERQVRLIEPIKCPRHN